MPSGSSPGIDIPPLTSAGQLVGALPGNETLTSGGLSNFSDPPPFLQHILTIVSVEWGVLYCILGVVEPNNEMPDQDSVYWESSDLGTSSPTSS